MKNYNAMNWFQILCSDLPLKSKLHGIRVKMHCALHYRELRRAAYQVERSYTRDLEQELARVHV